MEKNRKIVGLCGSLRKGSYNAMLLKVAGGLIPEGFEFEIVAYDDIPVYNADHDLPETEERPASVTKFRSLWLLQMLFIIASPEYNYSIPGGLKMPLTGQAAAKIRL